jgi:hypothetical protein
MERKAMSKSNLLAATIGAIVASALAGGVAWATIPGDGGVIQGCYTKVGGILRVIDTAKGERCLAIEQPISWNQKGLKGDPGANGANGAPGASPTVSQLEPGDSNCPAGGAAITDAAGSTAYVCGGAKGADGQSFAGTFTSPNGEYSISVTDAGITVSHGQGTSFELVGDDLVLRAAHDFDLASSHDVGIHASRNFSLMADAEGLVKALGTLALQGSVVNIN